MLKTLKIKRVFICSLALEFCINYNALDARILEFETIMIEGATLQLEIGDSVKNTLRGFKNEGIHYGQLDKFI